MSFFANRFVWSRIRGALVEHLIHSSDLVAMQIAPASLRDDKKPVRRRISVRKRLADNPAFKGSGSGNTSLRRRSTPKSALRCAAGEAVLRVKVLSFMDNVLRGTSHNACWRHELAGHACYASMCRQQRHAPVTACRKSRPRAIHA